jgi:hypothetical protein
MSSVVVIFLPGSTAIENLATTLRQCADAIESTDIPAARSHEPATDADQLPLWQWFTF